MISHSEVKEFFRYDKKNGIIFWKKRPIWAHHIKVGDIAGNQVNGGYYRIGFKGKKYLRHRLAWFYQYGKWPKELDHINNVPGDDRISNLRPATKSQNRMNSRPQKSKSGLKGVFYLGAAYKTKPWWAYISKNKRRINLGLYETAAEASRARDQAARELHREFARPNIK